LAIANAQELSPIGITPGDIEQKTTEISTSWDYLSKEWPKILKQNAVVGFFDKVLTQISFVFKIITGEPYSLSLTFFITLIVWFVFFYMFGSIIIGYSSFKPAIGWIISLLLNIVFGQVGAFRKQADFLMWLALGDKAWYVSLIIFIVEAGILMLIIMIGTKWRKSLQAGRKKFKLLEEEMEIQTGAAAGKALTRAVSKAE
ncbi:MAG: hypothetical protein QXD13_02055, partial [Candidatus Pacearchaeota archaeon]